MTGLLPLYFIKKWRENQWQRRTQKAATIQGNLGHHSAAFTLDRYEHFTERMKKDSAARMEGFIKGVLNL